LHGEVHEASPLGRMPLPPRPSAPHVPAKTATPVMQRRWGQPCVFSPVPDEQVQS